MSTTINVKTSFTQNGQCNLDVLELSIRFHGAVRMRDVPQHAPVQVSIHLPDEWAALLPIVRDVSKERLAASKPLTPTMFPFLPLPSHFEPTEPSQWQQLAKQIEGCLVQDPYLDSKQPNCYHLMRELFWMAFVAANPEFPYGDFPRWNTIIAMDGDFITYWMSRDEDDESDVEEVQSTVWQQFRSVVSDALLMPVTQ